MLCVVDVLRLKHERTEYRDHFRDIIAIVIDQTSIFDCLIRVLSATQELNADIREMKVDILICLQLLTKGIAIFGQEPEGSEEDQLFAARISAVLSGDELLTALFTTLSNVDSDIRQHAYITLGYYVKCGIEKIPNYFMSDS